MRSRTLMPQIVRPASYFARPASDGPAEQGVTLRIVQSWLHLDRGCRDACRDALNCCRDALNLVRTPGDSKNQRTLCASGVPYRYVMARCLELVRLVHNQHVVLRQHLPGVGLGSLGKGRGSCPGSSKRGMLSASAPPTSGRRLAQPPPDSAIRGRRHVLSYRSGRGRPSMARKRCVDGGCDGDCIDVDETGRSHRRRPNSRKHATRAVVVSSRACRLLASWGLPLLQEVRMPKKAPSERPVQADGV